MDDLRELYQDLILDHGKNPRNFRAITGPHREALGHNPLCGDRLVLHLTLDESDVVTDIAFQGTGCAISIASASIMTEMLKGRTRDEAEKLFTAFHAACTGGGQQMPGDVDADDRARIAALAGVRHYPVRVKCATLAWHSMQAALKGDEKISTE
ncbi:MAG: SUF system NifU family Fe-S cluster assembly protein [Alphaproteobacteria bacterium]|nr:SUF system NifU family Fe-S cluster assembly protein [Alphaproteobacteria bacterium]